MFTKRSGSPKHSKTHGFRASFGEHNHVPRPVVVNMPMFTNRFWWTCVCSPKGLDRQNIAKHKVFGPVSVNIIMFPRPLWWTCLCSPAGSGEHSHVHQARRVNTVKNHRFQQKMVNIRLLNVPEWWTFLCLTREENHRSLCNDRLVCDVFYSWFRHLKTSFWNDTGKLKHIISSPNCIQRQLQRVPLGNFLKTAFDVIAPSRWSLGIRDGPGILTRSTWTYREYSWCIVRTHDVTWDLTDDHGYSWCVLAIHDAAWILMIHHYIITHQWRDMINHAASEALMMHTENIRFWFKLSIKIIPNLCSIRGSVWIGLPLRCMRSQVCFNATTASFALLIKRVHVVMQIYVFAIHRCGNVFIASENLKFDFCLRSL